jgi:hypothetical protein
MRSQPVTGFQVVSVHSIADRLAIVLHPLGLIRGLLALCCAAQPDPLADSLYWDDHQAVRFRVALEYIHHVSGLEVKSICERLGQRNLPIIVDLDWPMRLGH